MLKAFKIGFLLIATSLFVVGCASTSETTEPAEVESTPVNTASSSAANTGSNSNASSGAATPAPVAPIQEVDDTPLLQYTFYFEFDQSTLTEQARAALLAHAAVLKASPRSIRLSGHADERGTREYNIALGERRALAVRNFLRFEGVTSPIEVISYGEERPISYASTEQAYQLNRRVELK